MPDLLIIDAAFFRTSAGRLFLQTIRLASSLRHIPFVCCTASDGLAQSLANQGIPTVRKPFNLDELLKVVDTLVPREDTHG